jgi:hypothetical protein
MGTAPVLALLIARALIMVAILNNLGSILG